MEKLKKDHKKNIKIKPFISKHNWKGINNPSGMMTGKSWRKVIQQLLLMCYMLKNLIYILPTFTNAT